ncbi:hypothetical protein R6Q59_013436 [Mikania micrantha]
MEAILRLPFKIRFLVTFTTLVLLLIHFVTKKGGGNLVPNAWQSLVELIYDFVLNLGMIPYSFTVTRCVKL